MKFKLWILAALAILVIGSYSVQAKSNTLAQDNAILTTYAEVYNVEFFQGRLQHNTPVAWADIPRQKNDKGQTVYVLGLLTPLGDGTFKITVDTKSNITMDEAEMTIVHEECHELNRIEGTRDENDEHGPAFQSCMKNRALQGGFEGLW